MTPEKICPIMSRVRFVSVPAEGISIVKQSFASLATCNCQEERCMAWVPEKKETVLRKNEIGGCNWGNHPTEVTTGGYCSLIKNGGK